MNDKELTELRKSIVNGRNDKLKEIYLRCKKDCIDVMVNKRVISRSESGDIYTDAFLVFRDNILSGKIEKLSSAKSYIMSTCLNMAKEKLTYAKKKLKKEKEVRLLLYENNHYINEDKEYKQDLIEVSQKALKSLTEGCQKIIVAFYIYKIPMKELAKEFGFASADVVKTKKMRCYKSWIKKTKSLMKV
ncbi:MAG: hypothetical protein KJN84_15825 [Bacteroidia bacterium]|nr:hypothetical protein [Bacteroidia bacterium]